jgi:NDP-sugar pyrophosphorylase family protein
LYQSKFFGIIPEILKPWFPDDKPMWFILAHIKEAIYAIVNSCPGEYNEIRDGVFAGINTKIDKHVEFYGPALIGKNSEIRQGAFLRENVIIGDNCVVGNSTELKNSVLFDNVEAPHFNYVGDSILGNYAHLGAGVKISNVLLVKNKKEKVAEAQKNITDGKNSLERKKVKIKMPDGGWVNTELVKFGAIIGDYAEIGVNTTINPGTLLEMNMFVPPSLNIGGYFGADYVFPRSIIYASDSQKSGRHSSN